MTHQQQHTAFVLENLYRKDLYRVSLIAPACSAIASAVCNSWKQLCWRVRLESPGVCHQIMQCRPYLATLKTSFQDSWTIAKNDWMLESFECFLLVTHLPMASKNAGLVLRFLSEKRTHSWGQILCIVHHYLMCNCNGVGWHCHVRNSRRGLDAHVVQWMKMACTSRDFISLIT